MIGYDLLGLGHRLWPVPETIRAIPEGAAIGCFYNTFGLVTPNLRKLLQSGKYPVVRIHLWWSTTHKIIPVDECLAGAKACQKLAEEFRGVQFYVSHSCEHNEQNLAVVRARMNILKKNCPSCIPVNCVWRGALVPRAINENHDLETRGNPRLIKSTDGFNIYDIEAQRWMRSNKTALIRFLWGARFNLRENPKAGEVVPPPKDRTAVPSLEYMQAIVALASPIGKPPKAVFKSTPINAPLLYKTFAEDVQGTNDPRENKPVLLLPKQVPFVEVVTCKNKPLGRFAYGGTFEGLFRYYSGLPGGLNKYGAQIAEMSDDGPWVWFKMNDQCFGPVNAAFRAGYFRG